MLILRMTHFDTGNIEKIGKPAIGFQDVMFAAIKKIGIPSSTQKKAPLKTAGLFFCIFLGISGTPGI